MYEKKNDYDEKNNYDPTQVIDPIKEKKMRRYMTVSYTHLDVYKRQAYP